MKSVGCREEANSGLTCATCVYTSFRRWNALRVGAKPAGYNQKLHFVCDAQDDSLSKRLFVNSVGRLIILLSATPPIVAGVTSMHAVDGM